MEKIYKNLSLSDSINILFVLVLLGLTLAFPHRVGKWYLLAPLYFSMLAVSAFLIFFYRGNTHPNTAILRRWYPLVFIPICFFSLSQIVHRVVPRDFDSQMIAFDYTLFGVHPTIFLSKFLNPYLVDLLELCYASFYWLPVILAFFLFSKGRMREFESAAAAICLGFYLSYIGNLLMPVQGPRFTLSSFQTSPVEGMWLGNFIRESLFALEPYKWDCFPSGHTAVTLIVVILSYRYIRWLFWIMLPVAIGLIASTVFLQYHYVVDILAGALLAGIVIIMNDFLQRVWYTDPNRKDESDMRPTEDSVR
jgi:membrane-associated phospholipid phosphatase